MIGTIASFCINRRALTLTIVVILCVLLGIGAGALITSSPLS